MKKLFTLFTIAAAATIFAGCSTENDSDSRTKLTLSAAPLTINIDNEGIFTVTSDTEALHDIVITATSSNEQILKINDDSKSVTIPKGETTVTGKFTGLAVGNADITITSSDAQISVASVNITVEEDTTPPNPKILVIDLNYTSDPAPINAGKDWCAFSFPSPDSDNLTTWQVGGLWVTNKVNGPDPGSEFITCIDNYGMLCAGTFDNATGKVNLSIFEKDVDISSLDFIENVNYDKATTPWYWPVVYSETYKSLVGKSGYIVMYFIYSNTDKDIEKGAYPAWIKVNVANDGAVTVEDMAINCSEESFRTGQKK